MRARVSEGGDRPVDPRPRGHGTEIWVYRTGNPGCDRVMKGVKPALHAAVGVPAVGQARVMAQNGVTDQFGAGTQAPGRAGVKQRGPGCRVIDPDILALQDTIEGRVVFAEIVEKPSHMRRRPQPQGRRAFRCQ